MVSFASRINHYLELYFMSLILPHSSLSSSDSKLSERTLHRMHEPPVFELGDLFTAFNTLCPFVFFILFSTERGRSSN